MPNYCSCDLFVHGDPTLLQEFLATMTHRAADDSCDVFDFNGAVPMPPEIAATHEYFDPAAVAAGHPTRDQYGMNDPAKGPAYNEHGWPIHENDRPLTKQEVAERLEKYGAVWWYDWAIKWWGTKWNAGDYSLVYQKPRSLKIRFETAWSPPSPVIAACAKKWPALRFALHGYEMGAAYQSHEYWVKGALVKAETRKYNGERGG